MKKTILLTLMIIATNNFAATSKLRICNAFSRLSESKISKEQKCNRATSLLYRSHFEIQRKIDIVSVSEEARLRKVNEKLNELYQELKLDGCHTNIAKLCKQTMGL